MGGFGWEKGKPNCIPICQWRVTDGLLGTDRSRWFFSTARYVNFVVMTCGFLVCMENGYVPKRTNWHGAINPNWNPFQRLIDTSLCSVDQLLGDFTAVDNWNCLWSYSSQIWASLCPMMVVALTYNVVLNKMYFHFFLAFVDDPRRNPLIRYRYLKVNHVHQRREDQG